MYDIDHRTDRDTLTHLLSLIDEGPEDMTLDDKIIMICQSDEAAAGYWISVFQRYCTALETRNRHEERQARALKFQSKFSFELVSWVFAYSDKFIPSEVEDVARRAYPRLALLQAIHGTSWQAYMEKMPPATQLQLFNVLNDLPQPFGDTRFSALPVHTECYRRGNAHSSWLLEIPGHYQKVWNADLQQCVVEKMDHAQQCFYLDAKIGVLFLFEGKPSLCVTFHVDKEGEIYVHQIQAKLKDRGHYRLGEDWRSTVLQYLCQAFSQSAVYVIDGDQCARDNESAFHVDIPAAYRPTAAQMARIASFYNNITGLCANHREKSGRLFRAFCHTR